MAETRRKWHSVTRMIDVSERCRVLVKVDATKGTATDTISGFMNCVEQWFPDDVSELTAAELAVYRCAREEMAAELSKKMGIKISVVDTRELGT